MKALFPVIRREYLQRVRSRWFLFGTVLAPAFVVGAIAIPALLEKRNQDTWKEIGLVDRTGVLQDRVRERLEQVGFTVHPATPGAEELLQGRIRRGELGGYLVLTEESLSRGRVEYHGTEGPGALTALSISGGIAQAALEYRLEQAGGTASLEALLAGGELDVVPVGSGGAVAGEDDPELVGAFVGAMLLYMVILLYAVAVMRATMEEKTGRVVEILISSVRPWELMLGKILGVGSVGLTQLAVWILFGVLALTMGLPALVAARPEMVDPEFLKDTLPGAGLSTLFVALFLGGYFLYAALYAAVGAMCSTEEEAQQAQLPVVLLLVLPVLFLMPVIENPSSHTAVAASLVPFFSPVLLYARAATGSVPAWQIGAALSLLFGGVLVVAWLAGRIYRVGILMQGKRPTLPELWRWVRET
ncbi:MAG: ABC transporter permease [Longimicrobiales bacterium]